MGIPPRIENNVPQPRGAVNRSDARPNPSPAPGICWNEPRGGGTRLPEKGVFPVSCSKNCNSGCGCNGCRASLSCCNSCGCNGCATHSTGCGCGCSGCTTLRSTGCGSCATARVSGCHCASCNACAGRIGVLRTVSGPFVRSGCCGNWNFPFYTGPCGPCSAHSGCNGSHCLSGTSCDSCGCNTCCDSCCNDCCDNCSCNDCCCDDCGGLLALAGDCDECHASASFAADTPVELAAGDAVELSPTFANTGDFTASQEGVRIHRAGDYLAVYTVHIPAQHAVSSRFLLTLDGARIEASAQDVATVADCSTNGYTMHAMFHAEAGSLLKLVSLRPVSVCASSASNVFTLSLTRIP